MKKGYAIFLMALLLTSGPLNLSTIINLSLITQEALAETRASDGQVHSTSNNLGHNPVVGSVDVEASPQTGSSPLFVTFKIKRIDVTTTSSILVYKWDFDGDGRNDYVDLDTGNTTHVYEVNEPSKFDAALTILYSDGGEAKGKVTLEVSPRNEKEWLEVRDLGSSKVGVNRNGTIFVYDSSSWLPLTFRKYNVALMNPSIAKVNEGASRLTFSTKKTLFDITLEYGVIGRVLFNFTEYLPRGSSDYDELLVGPMLPAEQTRGRLSFRYESSPPLVQLNSKKVILTHGITESSGIGAFNDESENSPPQSALLGKDGTNASSEAGYDVHIESLDFKSGPITEGTGNAWGSGGAAYSPWNDQGLVPYGEYFKNLNEYVSTETGYLTVTQTDLIIPGRGLDLVIKRVYAPPSTYENETPASAPDYTYQAYPWAPIGNGWELGFPWMEKNGNTTSFIHLGNGQRYEYFPAGVNGYAYHSGDHFKLYQHANNTYSLYTVDGIRYRFDSTCKPTRIDDPSGNYILFSYNGNNKISSITDTIGRTVNFTYNGNGYVSEIVYDSKTITFSYTPGLVSGYRLSKITDPDNRTTTYKYFTDYILAKIEYPTGGHSSYDYNIFYSGSGYSRYRVSSQIIYDGSSISSYKTYQGSQSYDNVDYVVIREYESGIVKKSTRMDYQNSSYVSETVYEGEYEVGPRLYESLQYIDITHRRSFVEKYPGNSTSHIDTVQRYDNWGNLVFKRDYENHNAYSSYANTDGSNKFIDSGGGRIYFFSDSFYSNSVNSEIHNLIIGKAELQNGTLSLPIESYFEYDSKGQQTEVKQLLEDNWLLTKKEYDPYGNLRKLTDPNDHVAYYDYNSTYSGAYLTSKNRTLSGSPGQNMTQYFKYDYDTGLLTRTTDEKGNSTSYEYDVLGRVTRIIYPITGATTPEKTAGYFDEAIYSKSYSTKSVGNTASSKGIYWTGQFVVRAANLRWVFYYDGSSQNVRYRYSSDGDSWSSYTDVFGTADATYWDFYFDGVFFHFAYSCDVSGYGYVYYRRCLPCDDGTLNWSTDTWQTVSSTTQGQSMRSCSICVDSNGYAWVSYQQHVGSNSNDIRVSRNSALNGSWVDWAEYNDQFWTSYNDEFYMKWVALTDGKMAYIQSGKGSTSGSSFDLRCKVFDGTLWEDTWESVTNWGASNSYLAFDVVGHGDDVHIVYQKTNDGVQYRKRSYESETWGNETYIIGNRAVQLSGAESGELYAFYVSGSNINYKYFNGTIWGSETTFISGDNPTNAKNLSVDSKVRENKISVTYLKGAGYTVKHKIFSVYDTRDSKATIYDENDNKVINYYDGLSRLKKFNRYNGSTLYSTEEYSYNYLGLMKEKITAIDSIYKYSYNVLGETVKVTNPDSSYSETIYDYDNNTRELHDEEGRKRVLSYDWMNRLTSVREYTNSSNYFQTDYAYDEVGNLAKISDANGHETYFFYNQLNREIKVKYPDGSSDEKGYDSVGNLKYEIDQGGKFTSYTYDSLDRLVSVKYYESPPWLSGWQYRKPITIQTTVSGQVLKYQVKIRVYYGSGVDSPPNLYCNSTCRSDFGDIRFTRSDGATLLDYWMAKKVNSNYADFWVEVYSIAGSSTSNKIFVYYGNAGASTTSNGTNTFYAFDDLEDYSSGTTLPFGDFVAGYVGQVVRVNDTLSYVGSKAIYTADNRYDSYNHFEWNFDDLKADSYRVHMAFYQQGNTDHEILIDLFGGQRFVGLNCTDNMIYSYSTIYVDRWHAISQGSYSSDSWHVLEICFPMNTSIKNYLDIYLDGAKSNDEYAEANSPSSFKYIRFYSTTEVPKGVAWFDAFFIGNYREPEPSISSIGSSENVNMSASPAEATYTYDKVGNKESSLWNGTKVSTLYDARNRPVKESFNVTGTVYNVEYGYDDANNMVFLEYPNGSNVTVAYDKLDRVKALGTYANFTYTLDDKIDTIIYSNNVVTDYTYDSRSRPTCIRVYRGGNTLLNSTYTYDSSGSIIQVATTGQTTETYGYDQLDRLTSTTGPWGSMTFTYDAEGNRLTKSSTSYSYNNMNRLTCIGASDDLTYDSDGNLLRREVGANHWDYSYDVSKRLITVKYNDSVQRKYQYDADGRRVQSFNGASNNFKYVYSGLSVVYEVPDGGGAPTLRLYAGGLHVAEKTGSTVTYLHQDHLGSTRLKTDSSGNAVFTRNYEPFGVDYGSSGSEEFKYTGKPSDDTGLYYFGARYYDPAVGRFITEDLSPGDLSDPQSLNRYVYCRNNPHKYTDPNGRWIQIAIGAGIGATIAAVSYFIYHGSNGELGDFLTEVAGGAVTGAITAAIPIPVGLGVFEKGVFIWLKNTFSAGGSMLVEGGISIFRGKYETESTIDPRGPYCLDIISGSCAEAVKMGIRNMYPGIDEDLLNYLVDTCFTVAEDGLLHYRQTDSDFSTNNTNDFEYN